MAGQDRSGAWEGGYLPLSLNIAVDWYCVVIPVSISWVWRRYSYTDKTKSVSKDFMLWLVGLDFFQQALERYGWQPALVLDSNKNSSNPGLN